MTVARLFAYSKGEKKCKSKSGLTRHRDNNDYGKENNDIISEPLALISVEMFSSSKERFLGGNVTLS